MSKEDKQPEFEIDDPGELSQKTRIRELLSRRTNVIDARDRAFDAMTLGEATQRQALGFYRSRVESLILDLWTKFENEDLDEGKQFLDTVDIDTIVVHPPEELDADNLAAGEEPPQPKQEAIKGLKWFIENDGPIRVEFTARSWSPPGKRTVVAEQPLPRRTLDRALVACMEFIDVAGIDVSIDQTSEDPLEV